MVTIRSYPRWPPPPGERSEGASAGEQNGQPCTKSLCLITPADALRDRCEVIL